MAGKVRAVSYWLLGKVIAVGRRELRNSLNQSQVSGFNTEGFPIAEEFNAEIRWRR
jgi:hypothetical protein